MAIMPKPKPLSPCASPARLMMPIVGSKWSRVIAVASIGSHGDDPRPFAADDWHHQPGGTRTRTERFRFRHDRHGVVADEDGAQRGPGDRDLNLLCRKPML